MKYKESDLVLEVSNNVNPDMWDEGFYQLFLDTLFGQRKYQKEATETALRFLNSGEYKNLAELAKENFSKKEVIQERFSHNFTVMESNLDLADKLSATLDLATGTGKSYVMIALSLIMLARKKVNRVLILVPSTTIEFELTKKFKESLSNSQLMKLLGQDFIVPDVINGDSTIVKNSIVIENRDAIYRAQANRNSIIDGLKNNGETTLVLNDEVHHVYYSETNQWKNFITDSNDNGINFKYVIGLTGTAYKKQANKSDANEYFSDVIYRYSLREAIEQNYVKDIEYISKEDMPKDKDERWQVILNSHNQIKKNLLSKIGEPPITIIVTSSQSRSDSQAKYFKSFLKKERKISDAEVDNIVLSVHSGDKAALDRLKLKDVDLPGNKVEFIFSVAMLTEGWDVKRVFQIVPDEEKAFNSKLLISQVLGRGLRRPNIWKTDWGSPTVTIFNHEKWAPNVKSLVDDILEIRKTITTSVNTLSNYNFDLMNIKYTSDKKIRETMKMGSYNLWIKTNDKSDLILDEKGNTIITGVKLPTETEYSEVSLTMQRITLDEERDLKLNYRHEIYSIEIMSQILFYRFDDLEDKELSIEYKSIWPIEKIKEMIQISMVNSSNNVITKSIKNAFLSSMNVLFRHNSKSVTYDIKPEVFFEKNTSILPKETNDIDNFKKNKTIYYTSDLENSLNDDLSKINFKEIVDTSNGYKQVLVLNKYDFKSPQYAIITTGNPETLFLKNLINKDISKQIDSFIKSPDMNFYNFNYVWQKGSHHKNAKFNPDWFIKQGSLIIVVETKEDAQINEPDMENIGKNKAALEHFERLNKYLEEQKSENRYKFTFLTPKDYQVFFDKLKNKEVENFNSKLDIALLNK